MLGMELPPPTALLLFGVRLGSGQATWAPVGDRCRRFAAESRGCGALSAPPVLSQPGVDAAPPLHGLAALSCSVPVPCRVPAVSPLLLTCSPLCRSPLPPGPGAARRMHPAGSAGVLPGAVSPVSSPCPLCPHHVPCVLHVSPVSSPCPSSPAVSPPSLPAGTVPLTGLVLSLNCFFQGLWGEGGN